MGTSRSQDNAMLAASSLLLLPVIVMLARMAKAKTKKTEKGFREVRKLVPNKEYFFKGYVNGRYEPEALANLLGTGGLETTSLKSKILGSDKTQFSLRQIWRGDLKQVDIEGLLPLTVPPNPPGVIITHIRESI